MARTAVVAAAANASRSGQGSLTNESSRRRQRQRVLMQRGTRSPLDSDGRNNNSNGMSGSKYGAVDDAHADSGGDDDDDDDDDNDGESNNEIDNEDNYDEDFDEYAYTLSPSSYKRTMRLYAFVPFTAVLTLLFFTLLQKYVWPSTPSNPSISTTLSLLLLGIAFWAVSFALRIPLFLLSSHLFYTKPTIIPLVSSALQVLCEETLRFASIALAQISVTQKATVGDPSFSYVWTLALGWGMAEVVVSIWQGYTQLGLYSDVVYSSLPSKYTPEYGYNHHTDTHALELRAQARSELESLYDMPVPEIPISISCLLRVDTIMLSIALFLLISFSYLCHLPIPSLSKAGMGIRARNLVPRSPKLISLPSGPSLDPLFQFTSTIPTLVGVTVFHMLLGLAWTPNVLPRIGLHVASYFSCIAALGALFVGLSRWDAI